MKKQGIINAELAKSIASLGHKDTFMIADAGMPIPENVKVIDLALTYGIPKFVDVMDAILSEIYVESYILAKEIKTNNTLLNKYITDSLLNIPSELISHSELKQRSKNCKFIIRTGENTPYPNIIIVAGCAF